MSGFFGQNRLHRDAAEYYYDIVARHEMGVPDSVCSHVRECSFCQRQIRQLKGLLAEMRDGYGLTLDRMGRDIIAILNLHFQHLGERVTCSRVKPFLPGLLIPTRQIRIPTPITVHVDQCPDCAEDLALLRSLGLEPAQLERLSRFYGAKAAGSRSLCRRARMKIPAVAAASLAGIDSEILEHLCTCPECRAQLYQHRQRLLEARATDGAAAGTNGCSDVSMARLFDYVLPYDLPAGAGEGPAGPPQAAGGHVRSCRRCMERLQTLHLTVYGIAGRADSAVATVYTTAGDAKKGRAGGDLYPDYPINVEVIHRPAPGVARSLRSPTAACMSSTARRSRRMALLTAAVVAAAFVPLVVLFMKTSSTPGGVTLAQVVHAYEKAQNIHLSRYYDPADELIEECWISRAKNVFVTSGRRGRTLYDLGARRKYANSGRRGSDSGADVGDREYETVCTMVEASLGFTARDLRRDGDWRHVAGEGPEGTEVYEFSYTQESNEGTTIFLKQRVVLDVATNLPREVRLFERISTEHEWECQSRAEFEYLTEDELASVIGE
jgi:hypothetical protein